MMIKSAAPIPISTREGRLGDLEVAQPTIALAEEALETAVSAAGYSTSV
jgi:hypothetical protein